MVNEYDDRPRDVSDKKAENGISITNLLLALLIFITSIAGTLGIRSLDSMERSIDKMETTVSTLSLVANTNQNDVKRLEGILEGCKESHKLVEKKLETHEKRLDVLEAQR